MTSLTMDTVYQYLKLRPGWEIHLTNNHLNITIDAIRFHQQPLTIYLSIDEYNADRPIEITDDGDILTPYSIIDEYQHTVAFDPNAIQLNSDQLQQIQTILDPDQIHRLALTNEFFKNTDLSHLNHDLDQYLNGLQTLAYQFDSILNSGH